MRRLTVLTPAFLLVAAFGGGATEQEKDPGASLSEKPAGPASSGEGGTGDPVPSQ